MGIDYLSKNLASPDENVGVILRDMNDGLQRADTIIRGLLDFPCLGPSTCRRRISTTSSSSVGPREA